MKDVLEIIAKALVDNPDRVEIREVEVGRVTVFRLRVHPSDRGKIIGRKGRMIEAIRIIVADAGVKLRKRFGLEILE